MFDQNFVLNNTSGQPIKAMGGCGSANGQLPYTQSAIPLGTGTNLATPISIRGRVRWQREKLNAYADTS